MKTMFSCPVPTLSDVLNGLSFLLLTRECYDLSVLYSQIVHPIQTEPAFFTLIPLKPWTFETTGPVPATCHPETPLPYPVGWAYHATQTHRLAFSHLCISFLISLVLQLSNTSMSIHTWKCLHFTHAPPPPAWFMVIMLTSVVKQNEKDHLTLWLWCQRLGSLAVITPALQGKQWGLTIYDFS